MYKQTDYPDLYLGTSGLPVSKYGCLAIDWVNALNIAGYAITPEELILNMNSHGGFNDQGELVWDTVAELYPQVTSGDDYKFQQGYWGQNEHWVLEHAGITYDPWYGVESAPAGFVADGVSMSYNISPYQAPTVPEVTEPAPFQYTVQPGDTLGHIIANHYGLDSWAAIAAKIPEICSTNGISDPNLIHPGQVITLP